MRRPGSRPSADGLAGGAQHRIKGTHSRALRRRRQGGTRSAHLAWPRGAVDLSTGGNGLFRGGSQGCQSSADRDDGHMKIPPLTLTPGSVLSVGGLVRGATTYPRLERRSIDLPERRIKGPSGRPSVGNRLLSFAGNWPLLIPIAVSVLGGAAVLAPWLASEDRVVLRAGRHLCGDIQRLSLDSRTGTLVARPQQIEITSGGKRYVVSLGEVDEIKLNSCGAPFK